MSRTYSRSSIFHPGLRSRRGLGSGGPSTSDPTHFLSSAAVVGKLAGATGPSSFSGSSVRPITPVLRVDHGRAEPTRRDLADDAEWLTALLSRLLPTAPEPLGLLALIR